MQLEFGRKYWIVTIVVFFVFTFFSVGRNLLHIIKTKRQTNALERLERMYRQKILADSTLLEQLKYDDYLEEYAREHFHMQRRNEDVYILKD